MPPLLLLLLFPLIHSIDTDPLLLDPSEGSSEGSGAFEEPLQSLTLTLPPSTTVSPPNPTPTAPVKELENHFSFGKGELDVLSQLLLKIKQTSYRNAFGDRPFGNDAVEDAKKEVFIAGTQPSTPAEMKPFLYEGDILLNQRQAENILQNLAAPKGKSKIRRKRNFSSDPLAKWDKFPIKYRFHESLAFYEITQIIKAINFWENRTCISFERVDGLPDNEDYIEFFKGQGCYSTIGRSGGRQGVSIGQNCVKLGVIEHEIGHALGLWHEQSRPDAGSYVTVLKDYILQSYVADFDQQNSLIDTLGQPYDLGSVMHYGPMAFSVDKMTLTLKTKDPLFQSTIGQRDGLSFYDVRTINTAYCSDACTGSIRCSNGGYPHPSRCSECICPSGLGGAMCDVNAPPKNADCGGVLTATGDWQSITSPDFPDPGYSPDQSCSWVIKTDSSSRIEFKFVEDFSFLCSSTCQEYVELKIAKDFGNTGFRLCCFDIPKEAFVSESSAAVVIFRSALSSDVGFKLQFRKTTKPARTTLPPPTTTTTTTPAPGSSVTWSTWGDWSDCSRSCGGCGVKSRVRTCPVGKCDGRRQQFSTCNLVACPIDKHCARLMGSNKFDQGQLSSCDEPLCCPPFFPVNGFCQSDDPIVNDFIES